VVARVIGENLDMLNKLSRDVEDAVKAEKGAVNVRNPLATTKADLRSASTAIRRRRSA